ncbi:hypothetical protein J2Z21_005925 [Streptomyces griseochromogenes]|nr:hypothetical protein [Streptomyces griseochromogenes]MBP2052936.1 hypothetical protein [Streptomyces griseochromogenes]
MFVSLGALAGSAHASTDGTLPTATTTRVSAVVQTAVDDAPLSGLLPSGLRIKMHTDQDIRWD